MNEIQWLSYTSVAASKPTLNFVITINTALFVSNRLINGTGSEDINISKITNNSITIFKSGTNNSASNIEVGKALYTLIIGY